MARRECVALMAVAGAGWLGACQTEVPPPLAQAPADASAPAVPIAWTDAPDCQAKLGLLEQAARSGGLAAGERPPIVVVLPGAPGGDDWLAAPSVTIAADLPLAVHQRRDLADLDAPCVLMIEAPRDQRVEYRPTGRDTVRSFYQSGSRSERNPDYDQAQLRLRQAERAARDDDIDILAVGDPMLDLVGTLVGSVVSGFSQGRGERELEEAMVELTSTPRSLDRPIYRAYEFEQTTVLAGKTATIPIALLERPSGRVWRGELRQRERQEFAIVDGLDPRDRDYEARRAASLNRHEFERWQREPPRLQLSAIVAALRASDPAPPSGLPPPPATTVVGIADRRAELAGVEPRDLDAALPLPARALERPESVAPARPSGASSVAGPVPSVVATASRSGSRADPRAAGVVGILSDRGAGSGVYVRHDLVLTTAALVERASVVDVVAADGRRVLGLVVRTDPLRNLSLIQVARPGSSVALHDAAPVAPGGALEGLVRNGAGGITLASGRYLGGGAASGAAVPDFSDRVYIDAPALRDQPEATAWFLGDALVALGTGDPARRADARFAAVGAAEIQDFLYGPGGALAALP